MKTIHETPVLESKASTGKAKFWLGRVVTDGKDYFIQSESWQEGAKHLLSTPAKVLGKNIGKKNESTPKDQAIFDIGAKQRKKEDEGYHVQGQRVHRTFTLPMLAHSYEDKKHRITYPVYVQPKFNGIRCLFNSTIGFWSRQGNELIKEVTQHLAFDTHGLTVDGELILPQHFTFQQTIAAIKKFDRVISPQLLYRVYDLAEAGPFAGRFLKLGALVDEECRGLNGHIILAETQVAKTEVDMKVLHDAYRERGFEGAIIRTAAGEYKAGHRSDNLLKYKVMQDAEFNIIGFKDGVGKDSGAIIFQCVTPEGKDFDVRPEGTMEDRRYMFQEGEKYVGHKLTVRFQAYSDDKVPLFPVGVTVRDYE